MLLDLLLRLGVGEHVALAHLLLVLGAEYEFDGALVDYSQLAESFICGEFTTAVGKGLVLSGHSELVGDGCHHPTHLVACVELQYMSYVAPALQIDGDWLVIVGAPNRDDIDGAVVL